VDGVAGMTTPAGVEAPPTVAGPVAAREVAVALRGVAKRYGAFAALQDVDLQLERGRIHALVGQTGAGKSTCLGLIAGRVQPTTGDVVVGGRALPHHVRPAVARRFGVSAIYQELSLVPAMTALDNVCMIAGDHRFGFVDRRAMRRRYDELSRAFNVSVPPNALVRDLSVADRQMLEIMRALSVDCDIVLMDEPTAALAPAERAQLFATIERLRSTGRTILFVSHFLDEVLEHSDTVTVFRDGRVVTQRDTLEWSHDALVRAMLGAELETLRSAEASAHASTRGLQPAALEVVGLTTDHGVQDVSLSVARGEVLGLGGLVGSGRTSLIRALVGAAQLRSGQMRIEGVEVGFPRSPREAARRGIRMLPEDRRASGLMPDLPSGDNMLVGRFGAVSRAGFIRRRRHAAAVGGLAQRFGLNPSMAAKAARQLSGGDQQKLLLARCGGQATTVLLADEPTRGVDIGAKSTILTTIRQLADEGLAVILASSDLDEVSALSDRVLVLREGRVVAQLNRGDGLSKDRIVHAAFAPAVRS